MFEVTFTSRSQELVWKVLANPKLGSVRAEKTWSGDSWTIQVVVRFDKIEAAKAWARWFRDVLDRGDTRIARVKGPETATESMSAVPPAEKPAEVPVNGTASDRPY